MANSKRGGATRPSTERFTEEMVEAAGAEMESSDDEAPEEVTFEDSKAEALRSVRQALETARREKELLKEKRRKRQEMFLEQKKNKLLPVEVLEEIDERWNQKEEEGEAEQQDDSGIESEKTDNLPDTRIVKENYTVTRVKQRAEVSAQQQVAQDFLQSRLFGSGRCRTSSEKMLSLKLGSRHSASLHFVKKDWALEKKTKAAKLKKRWLHKQQVPSA